MSNHPLPEAPVVVFKRENVKRIWADAVPLLKAHWEEVSFDRRMVVDPDYEFYCRADETGALRVYAARVDGALVGYCTFFVRAHPRSKSFVLAQPDVLFVREEYRGRLGARFVDWCDGELKREGVHAVLQSVSVLRDFGPVLERLGYERVETSYLRRLTI